MFSNSKIRSNSTNTSGQECHHHGVDASTDSNQNKPEEYITDNTETERQEEDLTNLVNNNSSGINYLASYVKFITITRKYLYLLYKLEVGHPLVTFLFYNTFYQLQER